MKILSCDIHAHFEIRIDGKWLHYTEPDINRNYQLFGKMAGVRNYQLFGKIAGVRDYETEPIAKPKGIPADISKVTKISFEYMMPDAHTGSWLNAEEIKEVIEFHKKQNGDLMKVWNQWGDLFGNGWENFKEYPDEYPKEIEDIRLVFWFDN